jgi:hypothetical protein
LLIQIIRTRNYEEKEYQSAADGNPHSPCPNRAFVAIRGGAVKNKKANDDYRDAEPSEIQRKFHCPAAKPSEVLLVFRGDIIIRASNQATRVRLAGTRARAPLPFPKVRLYHGAPPAHCFEAER